MPTRHFGIAFASALSAGYIAVCGFMGATLTVTSRHPFEHFPAAYGVQYEDVRFASHADDLMLRGWLLSAGTPSDSELRAAQELPVSVARDRPIVLVHGWKRDRQSELDGHVMEVAAHLAQRGHPVLVFDLRGWGESEGTRFSLGPNEARDVRGAIDFLSARGMANQGVDVMGFSMGAAATLLAAGDDPRVSAVVEDSSYAELGPLLDRSVPTESGLPPMFTPGAVLAASWLTGTDLYAVRPSDAAGRLGQRHVPVLVIHGEADALVPVAHGRRVAASYGDAVRAWFVPGAGHVGAYAADPAGYLARVDAFLDGFDGEADGARSL